MAESIPRESSAGCASPAPRVLSSSCDIPALKTLGEVTSEASVPWGSKTGDIKYAVHHASTLNQRSAPLFSSLSQSKKRLLGLSLSSPSLASTVQRGSEHGKHKQWSSQGYLPLSGKTPRVHTTLRVQKSCPGYPVFQASLLPLRMPTCTHSHLPYKLAVFFTPLPVTVDSVINLQR